jgi:type IV pilus assembly protein PilV
MKSKSCPKVLSARQSGSMLLEALIAILVFSLGILTVIGIQAASIKMAADAQLRTRAALLANRLVGEMWTSGGTVTGLETKFKTGGAAYNTWLSDVRDPVKGLPGVSEEEGTLPTVSIVTASGTDSGQVRITLFWRTPSMEAGEAHQHTVISQISRN